MWRLFNCLGRKGGGRVSISSRVTAQNLPQLPDGRVLTQKRDTDLEERAESKTGGNGSSITDCDSCPRKQRELRPRV